MFFSIPTLKQGIPYYICISASNEVGTSPAIIQLEVQQMLSAVVVLMKQQQQQQQQSGSGGGIINSNPCHPTCASNLQLNVLLPGRSFPTSDLMRKNRCRCRIHFVYAMIATRSFRPIDVGYFDGSIDNLGATYRYAALTMLMAKTMTKWKRTAMATTMTTMMRAFVGLL